MSSPIQRSRSSPSLSPNPSRSDELPDINTDAAAMPDDDDNDRDEGTGGDLPMSMTASVILTNLPKDASQALRDVEEIDDRKGTCKKEF